MTHTLLSTRSAPWSLSLDYQVTALFLRGPYVLTFGEEHPFGREFADIWRLRSERTPEHVAALCDVSHVPETERDLVFDLDRQVIFVPLRHRPFVEVHSLEDGAMLDIVVLPGFFWRWPPLYICGQLLLATSESEKTCPPYGISRITTCEWRSDEKVIVRHLSLPEDLKHREKKRTVATYTLAPLHMTSTGIIIGASADVYVQSMDVLRWKRPHSEDDQEPDARLQLIMSLEDGELMGLESTASIGDDILLLCVYERFEGTILPGGCQMVVYAIDIDSLTVRWKADSISGSHCTLHFIPTLGVVITIGHGNIEDSGRYPPVTWIAVLDKDTGTCLRMEVINHVEVGAAVVQCTVSDNAEDPALVVVFSDGDHIITSLRDFVNNGLPKHFDDGSLRVSKTFTESVIVKQAVVGDELLVLLLAGEDDGPLNIHNITW